MDTSHLKRYAPKARRDFIAAYAWFNVGQIEMPSFTTFKVRLEGCL